MTNKIDNVLINFIQSKGQNVDECLLYLLSRKHNLKYLCSDETFQFLQQNNLIRLNLVTNQILPTVGIYEGEVINLPEVNLDLEQTIRDRIDEYRSLFKGIRSGSTGIKQKVISLMNEFCQMYNKTFDEVVQVTKVYMTYTDFHLISNADNFISKLDKDGNEISLLLLAFEEQDMDNGNDARTYKAL